MARRPTARPGQRAIVTPASGAVQRPGAETGYDKLVAAAVSAAPSLVAKLYQRADLGIADGATDESARLEAIKRTGLADLPQDKLKALIARARS